MKPATIWVAAAAAALAIAVRVDGALHFAFWQDEVGSARTMLEPSPLGTIRHVIRTESTPPAWYVLGWFVHRLGLSLEDVRIVSVLAGALLAGGVVIYARSLLPLWAAALAGLFVALGYDFVFHGRELRSYELHALLSFALAAAVSWFVRKPEPRRGVALALVVAFGSLTNYFFLLSLAAVVLWLWLSPALHAVRLRAVATIAAGLLPFAAWLPAMARQYNHRGAYTYIGPFRLHTVVTTYWSLFARAEPRTRVLHGAAPVLVLVAVVAGCALLARRSDLGRLTALLALVPVAAGAAAWAAGPQVYDIRNLIGVGPFAAIALAALPASLPSRAAAASVGGIAAALLVYGFLLSNRVPPVAYDRVAHALVAEGWTPRDPILLVGNFYAFRAPLEWYLPDRPALTLGEPGTVRCRRFFAVGGKRAVHARVPDTLSASRPVRKLVVARVDTSFTPIGRVRHGVYVLVAARGHSECVRAVPERGLNAALTQAS